MPEPIVFISHFRIKEGQLDRFKQLAEQVIEAIRSAKPRTLAHVAYADEAAMTATFIHVFGDAQAMDMHNEGADQRSSDAYEFIIPAGWEIYGRPSAAAVEMMTEEARVAGVALRLEPSVLAGFVRLAPG
ncbi:MAG: hypothetical protein E6J50_01725 [Chloroflexi bacterium]|nr:MAG: hypothetical protein E6J50_01725 [Chloroflexota bacterium]